MADWRNYYKKGLSQTAYRRDKAQLDTFDALESDWKELFRWVMSTAWEKKFYDPTRKTTDRLIRVWHNHVMTVLIEIVCKNTDEYKDTFVKSRGTVDQKLYTRNLREKIIDWSDRLDAFLRTRSLEGSVVHQDSSIRAAQSIRQHLADALQGKIGDKFQPGRSLNPTNQPYYQMLQAIKNIQLQGDSYIRMIEDSGKIDPSLALLLAYIRNYCLITGKFNASLLSLPGYYHNEVLRATPRPVEQDYTYIVVHPKDEGFTLYENTRFLAGNVGGQDLYYRTEAPKYLTGGKLARACTVFLQPDATAARNKLCTQEIDFSDSSDCTILFDENEHTDVVCGWMLESHMFILEEGKRTVTISFRLTDASASHLAEHPVADTNLPGAFVLNVSYAEGWMNYLPALAVVEIDDSTNLTFQFTIVEAEFPLSPCTEEMHGCTSTYPCVRILTRNENCPYDWAKTLAFDRIGIDVEVEGIRHFNLYNELGEIDSAQAFYPFGTQAERGTWFMFSHNETSRKTVSQLSLKGTWSKLPPAPGGYADIYRNYAQEPPLTNESFQIKTEYQKNEKWYPCPDTLLPLFAEQEDGLQEAAAIPFRMTDDDGTPVAEPTYLPNTACNRGTNLLFRVTLNTPSIGFGMEEYRRLFADVMIYNSSRKEKEQKEIPASPVVPLLSDIELSYKASWNSHDAKASPARLQRIAGFNEYEACPLASGNSSIAFLEDMKNERNLYLKFAGMKSDKKICMYIDLSYVRKDMFLSDGSFSGEAPSLELDYRKDGTWLPLQPEYILLEATCGLTQNGFVELFIPQEIQHVPFVWLRARLQGHSGQYPAIRNIFLNCLKVVAENGDGISLPAATIQKMQIEDPRVESILQPLPGFGGKPREGIAEVSIRQSARIAHRNRAVTPKDYERMVLEQFPDLLKVHCLSSMCTGDSEVYVVVFSYTDGNPYPTTPAWKLAEIRNWLSTRISPFVSLKVCNPAYRKVDIACEAVLQKHSDDEGEIRRRMVCQIRDYFALWLQTGELPELGKKYSYKELHTRLANDPDVQRLVALTIDGVQPDVQATNINAADHSIPDEQSPIGTVLIPYDIRIVLLPFRDTTGPLAD